MFCVLLSALLLILAFPKFSLWPLAWVAFVPIVYRVERLKHFASSFFYFYLFGFLFFLTTWEWLRHVTYFGWIALVFLYANYFGLFGLLVCWFLKKKLSFLSLFALPSAWTVLEWIRAEIPIWGFGWNLLAHSQSSHLGIAHMANSVGAYGLSWVIVLTNLVIYFFMRFVLRVARRASSKDAETRRYGALTLAGVGTLIVISFLNLLIEAKPPEVLKRSLIRAAVIQGNIPQEGKWDRENKLAILETHEKLSRFVSYDDQPDLIIWPEAAYPGYFNLDLERDRVLRLSKELKIPILLGSPHIELLVKDREVAYNSAYLVNPKSLEEDRYDKVRLVPFGEYVPWRKFFGPLGIERFAYSLGVSDFERGRDVKVFSLPKTRNFSVLICFEDTFPYLARRAVNKGAQFLIVITNDAWFGKSAAPYQHLQASVFRAIENGVPVIQAANTGVSAFIDPSGKVIDRIKDQYGHDTFVAGGLVRSIALAERETFYRKRGYQFPFYCLIFVLASFILSWLIRDSSRQELDFK